MNNITIEFCAEDRARLDRIAGLLEANIEASLKVPKTTAETPQKTAKAEQQANAQPEPVTQAQPQKAAPESVKTAAAEPAPESVKTAAAEPAPESVKTAAAEPAPVVEEETTQESTEPSVTLAQIQQKVVQLAAGFNGTKKAKVREIVNKYAAKVSDLPKDKWDEVWGELTKLEEE